MNTKSHRIKTGQALTDGYSMVRMDDKPQVLSLTNWEPYLFKFPEEFDKTNQVIEFTAQEKYALTTIRKTQGRTIGKEVLYYENANVNTYNYYGRKLKKDGVAISLTYKVVILRQPGMSDTMSVTLHTGAVQELIPPLVGYIYVFLNVKAIETTFPAIIYANNTAAGIYFRLDGMHEFRREHVLLNPLYPSVIDVDITVTGPKDALENNLKLDDEPLVLNDITEIVKGANVYAGYATISSAPAKLTADAPVSLFVQAGTTPETFYSYNIFGPIDMLPQTETETTAAAVAVVVTTTPIPGGYNEFKIVCDLGFYGLNCNSRCSCGHNCRIDGTCTNLPCRLGTFGTRCLHEDLTLQANEISPPELSDGDKDTSVNMGEVKVEVNLHEPTPTNSFTFVFKDGSDLNEITKDKFNIQVWDEKTKSMVPFTEEYEVNIEDQNTVTVHWKKPSIVQKMQVTVATNLNATSFHLDGGHKAIPIHAGGGDDGPTGLKSQLFKLQVGDKTVFPNLAKNLTDGNRLFSSCIVTDETDIMTMTFEANTHLLRLMMYTPGTEKAWKAEVVCYDTADKEVLKTQVTSSGKRIYQVNVNLVVLKVKIKLLTGTINMCEIEPFVTIPPLLDGYNEFKLVCDPGFYGEHCSSRCSCGHNCRIDGTCTNLPCRLGTFGSGCKHADLSLQANEISPPELSDGDKDTSVNLGEVKVEVNLHEPTPTNSFTFVFKDGSDISGITKDKFDIQVWDEETNSMVAFTEEYDVTIEDDKTVTVHWKNPRILQKMQVTVATDQSATSFHLDGGHKADSLLAGEGNTGSTESKSLFRLEVGDTTVFPNLAKNLTDGDRFSSCIDTDETDIMTLTFEANTLLLRLMMYTPGTGKAWKAEVVCYDTADKEVLKTQVTSSGKRIYQVNVNMNVLKVKIKLLTGTINMCEIEPFIDPKGPLVLGTSNQDNLVRDTSLMWTILGLMLLVSCFLLCLVFLLGTKRSSPPLEKDAEEL
ncbi:uncharacterized protein LOC131949096 isoform X2 [Physella acuta]|uniref:uncharacterized protein LOC131949096 isoform X2 n=1 Tax=Physella acuta TaxID=109671 RepID=UPI0027DBDC07|nr:uncharacterized protein LOC131949096 isoform X2 [Physella acuta]